MTYETYDLTTHDYDRLIHTYMINVMTHDSRLMTLFASSIFSADIRQI